MGNNGIHVVVAAIILGISLIGASYLLSQSIEGLSRQAPAFAGAVANLQQAGGSEAKPAAAPAPPPRRRGPDPSKVYTVSTTGAASKGPKDAKVTVVEFSDFQCPFCSRVAPTLARLQKEYPNDVKIVFRHLPLSFHKQAQGAAEAAEAAGLQGKFWEMHDKMFAEQRSLSDEKYAQWAAELGLDVEKFKKDMKSSQVQTRIARDKQEAAALGVSGTPGFFINGRFLSGAKAYSEFKTLVDKALAAS
ncbi:MAG: thioredoxin domain-containing protein [Myxococcota bacterium]|jgi:protein-disulfide isomerase|nr:thioredoxin domain-containing protein [Myxococcota bacterium]